MKNVWKMIIAFALVACMALAFIACDYDDVIYNGDSNYSGETVGDGNETVDSEETGGSNRFQDPVANTESGWSQLYPAG